MNLDNYLRFAAALIFVLALIGLTTWLARRFGLGNRAPQVRSGQRRLGIVEERQPGRDGQSPSRFVFSILS